MKSGRSPRTRRLAARALAVAGVAILPSTVAAQALARDVGVRQPDPGKLDPRADFERPVVGMGVPMQVVPEPGAFVESGEGLLWTEVLRSEGASFLKAHFAGVNLRPGDEIVVRSRTARVVERITGRGPRGAGTFWGLSAFGDEFWIEFRASAPYDARPFEIDEVVVGEPGLFVGTESVCFPADFEDVICYQGDAGKWDNVLASVGVMSVGGNPTTALFCSGSNVSPLNYVLTNDHCLASQGDCDNTEFVFKYYRTGCNNGSPPTTDWQAFRCDQLVANSPVGSCDATLSALDFSLCSVIGDPAATFGYAQADPAPLTDGEDIYIVQHPAGRPHEITHGGGANVDVDGTTLRYYDTLDTEGGSSGSPIFREADDKLIGLHHCGGCSTGGVGNRGMLMSDIYPLIESFLCTTDVELSSAGTPAFSEVTGNGDALLDPGETWEFTPSVRNSACDDVALGVTAAVQVNPASAVPVQMLQPLASFGDVGPGSAAGATTPVRFRVGRLAPCGGTVLFDLVNLQATNGGPYPGAPAFASLEIGYQPFVEALDEDFGTGGPGWAVVDGGSGTGAASTWTTSNPGGRSLSLLSPFFIVDSDEQGSGFVMDEELISPVVDLSDFTAVTLQFAHDFNWYSGGLNEQADVDVRSSATGGAWVTVENFSGNDASGTVMIDVSAQAAGQSDVQVRFHYYDADFEWWWAVDDVVLLGSSGHVCHPFGGDYYRRTQLGSR